MEPDDPHHIVANSVMRLCFSRAWESIAIGNFQSGSLVKIPPTLAGMGKENVWAELTKRKLLVPAGAKVKAKARLSLHVQSDSTVVGVRDH